MKYFIANQSNCIHNNYIDMTPESQNNSLLSNGSVNMFHGNKHACITEELPFLYNGEVSTPL
jgi:hypothetical protein